MTNIDDFVIICHDKICSQRLVRLMWSIKMHSNPHKWLLIWNNANSEGKKQLNHLNLLNLKTGSLSFYLVEHLSVFWRTTLCFVKSYLNRCIIRGLIAVKDGGWRRGAGCCWASEKMKPASQKKELFSFFPPQKKHWTEGGKANHESFRGSSTKKHAFPLKTFDRLIIVIKLLSHNCFKAHGEAWLNHVTFKAANNNSINVMIRT